MKNSLVKKLFGVAALGTALTFGNFDKAYAPNLNIFIEDNFSYRKIGNNFKPNVKRIHKEILSYAGETDTLYIPEYPLNESGVPSTHCSRYAKKMAKDVFNLDYPSGNAWDIRKNSKIILDSKEGFTPEEIDSLVKIKEIQPGMLFGIYNPKSHYNHRKRLYTHVGGYLANLDNAPMIAHQWGSETRVDSLKWFYNQGMRIVEILDAKEAE